MRQTLGALGLLYLVLLGVVGWFWAYSLGLEKEADRTIKTEIKLGQLSKVVVRIQHSLEAYRATRDGVWVERMVADVNAGRALMEELGPDYPRLGSLWEDFTRRADKALGDTLPPSKVLGKAPDELLGEIERTQLAMAEKRKSQLGPFLALLVALASVAVAFVLLLVWIVVPARKLEAEVARLSVGDIDKPVGVKAPGTLGRLAEKLEALRRNLVITREQMKKLIRGK